eukprot:4726573-Pleurochrysis_carterae.AAC.2
MRSCEASQGRHKQLPVSPRAICGLQRKLFPPLRSSTTANWSQQQLGVSGATIIGTHSELMARRDRHCRVRGVVKTTSGAVQPGGSLASGSDGLHGPVLPKYMTKSVRVSQMVEFMWKWLRSEMYSLYITLAEQRWLLACGVARRER